MIGAQFSQPSWMSKHWTALTALDLSLWFPQVPETGARAWKGDGSIITPSTELVDAGGTYIGPDGLIRNCISNRLSVGQLGGQYRAGQTNLAIRSQQLNQGGVWGIQFGGGFVIDDAIAPDGTLTAELITDDGTTTAARMVQTLTGITDNVAYAVSGFVKQGTSAIFSMSWLAAADRLDIDFEWINGEPTVKNENIGTAYIEGRVPGTDWWRIVGLVPVDTIVAADTNRIGVYAGELGVVGVESMHWWGVQAEVGLFASPYIPTIAVPVTVAATDIRFDNAEGDETALPELGTVICVPTPDHDSAEVSGQELLVHTGVLSPTNALLLDFDGTGYRFLVQSGGVNVAILTGGTLIRGMSNVLVGTWALNDFRLYVDGVQVDSDTAGAAPAAFGTSLWIAQNSLNTAQFFGKIVHLMIFRRVLTLAQKNWVIRNVIAPNFAGKIKLAA